MMSYMYTCMYIKAGNLKQRKNVSQAVSVHMVESKLELVRDKIIIQALTTYV